MKQTGQCTNLVFASNGVISRVESRVTPTSWRSGHLDIPPGIDSSTQTASSTRDRSLQTCRKSRISNMVRPPVHTMTTRHRGLGTDRCPLGRPRRLHLHPRGQGCPLEAVPRNATIPDRSPSSVFPEARGQRHAAHHGRAGHCPLRLPAPGRALHGPDHEQAIEHPTRHRLSPPLRAGGLQHVQEPRRARDPPQCLRAAQRVRRASHPWVPGEPNY